MSERIVRLRISGVVQGVGFRAFVAEEAQRLSLRGWVRNRFDRSVEAVVAGAPDTIGELIVACRRGPPGSHVDAIEAVEADDSALAEGRPGMAFSILATT